MCKITNFSGGEELAEFNTLFETQKIENLPHDYEFNGNKTIETFFIHDDMILNIDFANQGYF